MPAPLLIDATRSVQRASRATPTGIDRVERAYLDHAARRGAAVLVRLGARHHLIPPMAVAAFLDALDRPGAAPLDLRARLEPRRSRPLRGVEAAIRRLSAGSAGERGLGALLEGHLAPGAVALNVGHANLSAGVADALGRAGARLVVLLHDTIPLDHPDFARPETPGRFRALLAGAAAARHLIFTTRAAEAAARARADEEGMTLPPGTVAALGIDAPGRVEAAGTGGFVCLGTIEGRKNHRLLLDIWQGFWETRAPEATPLLHIVGRRGWRAEDVFATLDSAPMMGRTVIEHADLDDAGVARLMAGARALLFPSFAEGFGIPLAEALAAGVPAIASDLPALREVGGGVPDWLAPTDRAGWIAAIDAYASEPSAARDAQIARMAAWRRPTWEAHFAAVDALIERMADGRPAD